MTIRSFASVCILLFPAIFGQVASAQSSAQAEGVRAALKAYDKAWDAKDVKAAGSLMGENYVYFDSLGGAPRPKADALKFLGEPDYKLTFVERSEIETIVSGNTAVVSSRWKGKGSWRGGTIDDDQRCGLVFVKQKGKWLIMAEHCTQIAAK